MIILQCIHTPNQIKHLKNIHVSHISIIMEKTRLELYYSLIYEKDTLPFQTHEACCIVQLSSAPFCETGTCSLRTEYWLVQLCIFWNHIFALERPAQLWKCAISNSILLGSILQLLGWWSTMQWSQQQTLLDATSQSWIAAVVPPLHSIRLGSNSGGSSRDSTCSNKSPYSLVGYIHPALETNVAVLF